MASSIWGSETYMPLPFWILISPRALRRLSASLSAVRLTPNDSHISRSVGSFAPTESFFSLMAFSIVRSMRWLRVSLFPIV